MSEAVFSRAYAADYDLFYRDKDYEGECDRIEAAFGRHGASVRAILDLGCGTGGHALSLARRGYEVVGVDRSDAMLERARAKAAKDGKARSVFRQGDARTLDLGRRFDAVLMMFAVLGYQTENQDVMDALGVVRRHLEPGGVFGADVWYGPAVLAQRPGDRLRVIPTDGGRVIRSASGRLDVVRQVAEVSYQIWHLDGDRVTGESSERHYMRFFFPQELALMCQAAGLDLVELSAFDDPPAPPTEATWNVLLVARGR